MTRLLSLPGATVQPMFLSNDVSHSDPALSSLSPRIPKTLRSRSSVGIEVLGCGTVQFGSADTGRVSAWQNGSERSDLKMHTAGCTDIP